ncbi:MAG: hypothetical protein ABSG95_10050 [Solirubrobacteraceae bacterium]
MVKLISAERRLDSALVGLISPSSSPLMTWLPTLTKSPASVPLVAKLTPTFVAGWSVPLPETVDWTTPCATVAVRVWLAWLPEAGPITMIAAAIAPAQRAPSG